MIINNLRPVFVISFSNNDYLFGGDRKMVKEKKKIKVIVLMV